jgi:hypothetical protein
MTSNFPTAFDGDANLYLAHDALRVRLAEDYTAGDTTITIEGDAEVFDKFPPTGLITLTDQCSDIETRAISFSFTSIGKRYSTCFNITALRVMQKCSTNSLRRD